MAEECQVIRFVRGHGDLRLAVDHWPTPGAQPVVLLHGGGQTRHTWSATGKALFERGYDVHSMDLRGHGDSAWASDANYSLNAFRDDLLAVLASFARPAVLVGASLGGIASLLVAGEGPSKYVNGLVLVDITPTPSEEGTRKIRAFMSGAPNGFGSIEEVVDAVADYLPHRGRRDPAGLVRNLRERDGRLYWHWDPAFLQVTVRESFASHERALTAARAISVPTLLVRGDLSEVVRPEDAADLVRLIPQAEIIVIRNAAHMVAGDQNSAFGAAMLAFIERIAPATLLEHIDQGGERTQ